MKDYSRAAALALARLEQARQSLEEESSALEGLRQKEQDLLRAREVAQLAAEACQNAAHARVAGVVGRCLAAVFGEDPYEFLIDFERKRGRTEARLAFARGELQVDPVSACGGGAVDVAAFALRLACVMSSRPRRRLFLALDEPFKHLSKNYRPAVKGLLESLCKELGLQILMVTHSPDLRIGRVIELA